MSPTGNNIPSPSHARETSFSINNGNSAPKNVGASLKTTTVSTFRAADFVKNLIPNPSMRDIKPGLCLNSLRISIVTALH